MQQAIVLNDRERAIVDRQCSDCRNWDNFKGCHWLLPNAETEFHPIWDCGIFELRPELGEGEETP